MYFVHKILVSDCYHLSYRMLSNEPVIKTKTSQNTNKVQQRLQPVNCAARILR